MYTAAWGKLTNHYCSYYSIACLIMMHTLMTIFYYDRYIFGVTIQLFRCRSFLCTDVINLFFVMYDLPVLLLNKHSSWFQIYLSLPFRAISQNAVFSLSSAWYRTIPNSRKPYGLICHKFFLTTSQLRSFFLVWREHFYLRPVSMKVFCQLWFYVKL
jgi:hypothetical protein